MVTNRKPTGRAASMPAGLAAGAAASLGLTLALAALVAKLVETERIAESGIGYGAMVILLLSAFVGAMISASRIKRQRLLVCLLSSAIYFGILLSMTALFFGGQYSGVGVTAILVLSGGVLAILIGLHGERGGKRPKIKGAYR